MVDIDLADEASGYREKRRPSHLPPYLGCCEIGSY